MLIYWGFFPSESVITMEIMPATLIMIDSAIITTFFTIHMYGISLPRSLRSIKHGRMKDSSEQPTAPKKDKRVKLNTPI